MKPLVPHNRNSLITDTCKRKKLFIDSLLFALKNSTQQV